MQKIFYTLFVSSLVLLASCGTPNEPESIFGGDGGYKIVSKFMTFGSAQDVLVKDTIAYVTHGEGGLIILSVSDQKLPKELSNVTQQDLKGYCNKIASNDTLIFISAGAWGVSTIDVSNPLYPIVKSYNVPIKPAKGMDVMGEFLFTAIGEEGFQVAKIDAGYYLDPRGKTSTQGFAQAVCVTADTNYLLVACGEMGFTIHDISYLAGGQGEYTLIGWTDTPGYAEDVVSHPTLPYAFMACGTSGFYIIDYSDSANVRVVGSYSTQGYAKEIAYKDGKAYVTTGQRGLQIFDVSNVTAPVRIGTVETKLAMGLAVDDHFVYVADEQEGLVIISIP